MKMNVNTCLVIEIIMEILCLPLISQPFILIIFIINGTFIIRDIVFLFSKSENEELIIEDKKEDKKEDITNKFTIDYNKTIKEITQTLDINEQVIIFFNNFNLDLNFLNQLLQKFTEEHKKEFIEKLISYCHKELSNSQIDFETRNYIIAMLSLAIKHKSN